MKFTKIQNGSLDALALLDALPVGVVVHGPDTRILHANRKALAVLRMTAEQALGKETLDFEWRRTADGFHARVVQHECDHLWGTLYPMRMRDLSKFGYTDVLFPGVEAAQDD